MIAVGSKTPWGKADYASLVTEGIVCVRTPSHGGYWVSKSKRAEMPACLRAITPWVGEDESGDGWYEEDCDWAIVCLAFPSLFPPTAFGHAQLTLARYKPLAFAAWLAYSGQEGSFLP